MKKVQIIVTLFLIFINLNCNGGIANTDFKIVDFRRGSFMDSTRSGSSFVFTLEVIKTKSKQYRVGDIIYSNIILQPSDIYAIKHFESKIGTILSIGDNSCVCPLARYLITL